ncbi:MAG TPA: aromatic ring-hydroxylating dioxygenase subunit alpha [Acidimicrobiales bacterium]|jgi:Rieske 2Fe-2S family protein
MMASQLVTEPTDAAPYRGLDERDWYRSEAALELERRQLFSRSWALVGIADEIEAPGSYLTVSLGEIPLVVVRGADGLLRAFHNVCRHRGVVLLTGSGCLGRFVTCPYHQWSYGLDGTLKRVPQLDEQFPGLDTARWGLRPAAAAEWHGMVFANPDPDAAALDNALGELGRRLDGYLSGPLVEVGRAEYVAACNWKFLVENHVDVYHLWYLHNRSLAMYEHGEFSWDMLGDSWWSREPLKDRSAARSRLGWLERPEREGIGAHLLFPNLMIVTTGDFFATYDAVPLAPDRTRLTLRIRSAPGADGDSLIDDVRSFMAEDIEICERLQDATGSPFFEVGPTAATHEEPIRRFHASLGRALRA